jgi:hypothetical protein
MSTAKPRPPGTPAAKSSRRVRLSAADLKFVSGNQQMAGFSGHISEETANHQPDMVEVAESAKRFNAQVPSPANRPTRPRVRKFDRPVDARQA